MSGARRLWFRATTTGTHYIAVSGTASSHSRGQVHGYRLSVVAMELSDDYAADTTTTGRVAVGDSVTGRFERARDEDWFAVELEAGTDYQINLKKDPYETDPRLVGVYDAQGTRLSHVTRDEGVPYGNQYGRYGRLYVTPAEAETYYIAVRSHYSEYEYEVEVVEYTGELADLPTDTSTPGRVEVGPESSVTGSIDPIFLYDKPGSDADWWAVEFVAGQTYRIEVTTGEWSEYWGWRLWNAFLPGVYNAQGTRIANTAGPDYRLSHFHRRRWFTATTTGPHYIAVRGWLDGIAPGVPSGPAHYRLSVVADTLPADDYPADTTTTGQVTVGGTVKGQTEHPGDVDWFAVELEAAVIYRIELKRQPDPLDPVLTGVYTDEGTLLPGTTDDDGGRNGTRVYVTPSVSGKYYIGARGDGGDGEYELGVYIADKADDFAADTTTTGRVTVGGSVTGEIEAADDLDWFAVEFTAQTTYRIEVEGSATGQGTLTSPRLRSIFNRGGKVIGGRGGTAGDWTASYTGTHYIMVRAAYQRTGTYRLSVTEQE